MASLPRPAPSLTTLLRARLVRTSRGLAQHALTGCHVLRSLHARLTSPGHSRRPNADGRQPPAVRRLAPTMPTWLRLTPVGVAGLEPAASRSQSGHSTKLSHTPLSISSLVIHINMRADPPGSSPTPYLFRRTCWRPCERGCSTTSLNHSREQQYPTRPHKST